MNAERLIAMANDIANFFAAEPDGEAAIQGVSDHFKRFWEPRMRKQIVAHVQAHGSSGLNDLASAAVTRLAETDRPE
jgi:formate dehydrogenase subunit delta